MKRKRKPVDWIVLGIVIINALVVIALSFGNTAKLAEALGLNPYLAAGLVELMFGTLLFIRGRQRALNLNVPLLLTVGYYASFGFVTAVNMWGLAQEHIIIGPIVGAAISGAMWLMENILVWLATEADKPYQKTLRDRIRETKRMIKEEKECQRLEWMKWEAQKPDLKLIKAARRAEQRRQKILENGGLPEFFRQQQPEKVFLANAQPTQAQAQIPMHPIGFHVTQNDEKETEHVQKSNVVEPLVHQRSEPIVTTKNDTKEKTKIEGRTQPKNQNQRDQKTSTKNAENKTTKHPKRRDSTVIKKAKEFYQENGRLPGRVVLARIAKCSDDQARKIVQKLKEQFKQNQLN